MLLIEETDHLAAQSAGEILGERTPSTSFISKHRAPGTRQQRGRERPFASLTRCAAVTSFVLLGCYLCVPAGCGNDTRMHYAVCKHSLRGSRGDVFAGKEYPN